MMGMTVVPGGEAEKVMGSVRSPKMSTELELRNPSGTNVKTSPVSETWLQVVFLCVLQNYLYPKLCELSV